MKYFALLSDISSNIDYYSVQTTPRVRYEYVADVEDSSS